ncbi:glycosyltransferase family 2 protein [Leclercia adecarboxylata]|uniref:Glycosyltransferase family 2 protein n=1 Tax=Leclercia adecarboxylata TaxID=83655 RepID=A0A9X3YC21_9ENTR|nr:glycosyltransferase family 2 protein [Leclercia adecarboxylata]MBD1405737.1 glycosyltransferase family 2 protein [Leclercia adecarboxylata]MDC6623875.1 glycosyltransferase family 92 protein [Leclercia adecarboxylata]MDC6632697.1 glycosyltransferase family 92 protein [Leclercia adecarboxylata]MDC6639882.1 glycosyltransferase family 92 protein [Leclercia adecarboxylata]MDC6651625.1 glycosyltransferase family 92 protein [Leclercia adecarboxylata]
MKLFVAAIIKNEMEALLEWIAYHRVVGVSGFIIADNGSNDGSRAFLDGLERLGIATVLDFPNVEGQKPQLPAYERILRSCSTDIDLLAFIDADEFLVPLDPEKSLSSSLDEWFSDPSVSAVALNWANFGSNGELFAEEGLVTERFTQRAPQQFNANKNFKSIVRPNNASFFNNPHHAELRYGRYVDSLGNDLVSHPKHGNGVSEEVVWNGVRVNHYVVKSLEEFLLGKHLRGSAATANRIKHKAYFKAHDRNDETCLLAAALAPKVKAEMAAIQAQLDALPAEESPQKSDSWLATRVKKLIG